MARPKPDFDRLGYFSDMSYTTVGDPYTDPGKRLLDFDRIKGRQMFGAYAKSKCGLNHGYFAEFQRTFVGEGLNRLRKVRSEEKIASTKRNIGPPFLAGTSSKVPNGSGTYFGTFSRNTPYFSTVTDQIKPVPSGRNIFGCPPKKGTGYGYAGVTINRYPPYEPSPYFDSNAVLKEQNQIHKQLLGGRREFIRNGRVEWFEANPYKSTDTTRSLPDIHNRIENAPANPIIFRPPNPSKLPGGCSAGTFTPFPPHEPNPYQDPYKVHLKPKEPRIFIPPSIPKSTRTASIMNLNVQKYVTPRNYKMVNQVMNAGCS